MKMERKEVLCYKASPSLLNNDDNFLKSQTHQRIRSQLNFCMFHHIEIQNCMDPDDTVDQSKE